MEKELSEIKKPKWRFETESLLNELKSKGIKNINNGEKINRKSSIDIPIVNADTPITGYELRKKESRKWSDDA